MGSSCSTANLATCCDVMTQHSGSYNSWPSCVQTYWDDMNCNEKVFKDPRSPNICDSSHKLKCVKPGFISAIGGVGVFTWPRGVTCSQMSQKQSYNWIKCYTNDGTNRGCGSGLSAPHALDTCAFRC